MQMTKTQTKHARVLAGAGGRILAILPEHGQAGSAGGPSAFGVTPEKGQSLHEVEVPDELCRLDPREMFDSCRVRGSRLEQAGGRRSGTRTTGRNRSGAGKTKRR
jgi:hypothetical protein